MKSSEYPNQDKLKTMPKHIAIKLWKIKNKEILLKVLGEKMIHYIQGPVIGITPYFSSETMAARRQ